MIDHAKGCFLILSTVEITCPLEPWLQVQTRFDKVNKNRVLERASIAYEVGPSSQLYPPYGMAVALFRRDTARSTMGMDNF